AGRRTSTGKRSTAVSALEPLRSEHEAVDLILEHRELSKLKSTYLDPLPGLVDARTGRLHTTFNQAVVATGRLSSTNPNLQNIPVRTELGRQIRRAFIADEGSLLLVADYSQIELRVLAHVADEPVLISAFRRGEDIHRRTAAEVYGVGPEEVTSEMRRRAKVVNFGILYGMGARRLSADLDIDLAEAERTIATYFERYPRVRAYIDDTLAFCREEGYVETLLGRRRLIPDIHSPNRNAREYAERTAYNMPIQGSAADIMKLAMLRLAPELERLGGRLLLQVHDEVVAEVPAARAETAAQATREAMADAYALEVPLVADVGVGPNWLEAK
ncbi:MAG: DNA polymerase, partial [Deinococcales bacterium]